MPKATKSVKSKKPVSAKTAKIHKAKAVISKSKKTSRRTLDDAKIAKLQKLYASKKHSAQSLCDQFGISMATLFNYLKVKL